MPLYGFVKFIYTPLEGSYYLYANNDHFKLQILQNLNEEVKKKIILSFLGEKTTFTFEVIADKKSLTKFTFFFPGQVWERFALILWFFHLVRIITIYTWN